MRWPDGRFRFTAQPKHSSADLFVDLLPQLNRHARRVGKRIVLAINRGSLFTAQRSVAAIEEARAWLQIEWLPLYSSEQLNEIEEVWRRLKQDYFSRMLVEHEEDFIPAALCILLALRHSVRDVL
jgi:transposase